LEPCLVRIQSINTRLLTRYPIPVRIIKVENPSFFWVQPTRCHDEFNVMIDSLNRRMARKGRFLHMPPEEMVPEETVSVRIKGEWFRAEICFIHDKTITVDLRDWATTVQVPMEEVYYLEDKFCQTVWQAIPCGLAHFQPIGGTNRWSSRVKNVVRSYMKGLTGRMRIRQTPFSFGAIVLFDIRHESESAERDLTELLIKMGCGEYTDRIQGNGLPSI